MHIGFWDIALLVVVSAQATAVAYLHAPRWKAFIITLPLPSTMAILALGLPVDATNVLGLGALLGFTHGVRGLHYGARLPILPSIAASAAGYCVVGSLLARVVPATDAAFWGACAGTILLGLALFLALPPRSEPGHRSPLPIWIKLPAIAGVIFVLILLKQALHGFMTLFPMVGVVASYEARHSLWTQGRQIPVLMLTLGPMLVAVRLAQGRLGLGGALVLGWLVFACVLVPLTRAQWRAAMPAGER